METNAKIINILNFFKNNPIERFIAIILLSFVVFLATNNPYFVFAIGFSPAVWYVAKRI